MNVCHCFYKIFITEVSKTKSYLSLSNPALAILWRVSKFYSELKSDNTRFFFLMCLSLLSQQWCFTSLLLSSPLKCDFLSGFFFFKENLQRHFCCISVSLDPFWSKPLTIRSYCLLDYLCLFLPSRCWRCPLGSFWPLCRGTLRLCCTVSSVRTAKHSSLHLRTPP